MDWQRWIGLVGLAMACGCTIITKSPSADAPARLQDRNMTVRGVEWHYVMFKPDGAKAPLPVLIALHGRGGTGEPFVEDSQLVDLADAKGFILIAPDAQDGQWRDMDKDPLQARDLAFFTALLDSVPSIGGDPKRVYVTGFSNGGGMTFFLGAALSDRIAAIGSGGASVAALDANLVYHGLPDPKRPIPAIIFHGMKDEISGYDMRTFTLPLPEAARWWAKRIGAGVTPKHEERAGGALLVDTFGAEGSPQVVLMSYRDMGHSWPSYEDGNLHTNFNEDLWAFLSKYKLP